jgi:DNA repair protein RecO (recombination protein O)
MCGELLVRFEMALLDDLGFGLDLSTCAATGTTANLTYVSPKSGRAVSGEAGRAFHDRMLPLPAYLIDRRQSHPDRESLAQGFELTGYFLDRDVFHPRGISVTESRAAVISRVADVSD